MLGFFLPKALPQLLPPWTLVSSLRTVSLPNLRIFFKQLDYCSNINTLSTTMSTTRITFKVDIGKYVNTHILKPWDLEFTSFMGVNIIFENISTFSKFPWFDGLNIDNDKCLPYRTPFQVSHLKLTICNFLSISRYYSIFDQDFWMLSENNPSYTNVSPWCYEERSKRLKRISGMGFT